MRQEPLSGKGLRVLLISDSLTFRGSTQMSLRIGAGLARRQTEVALVCPEITCAEAVPASKIRIHQLPGLVTPLWGRVVRQTVLRDLEDDDPPDLIHVLDLPMLHPGRWLANQVGCPLVVSVDDQSEARQFVPAPAGSQPESVIAVSDSVRDHLPQACRDGGIECRVILPGVRPSEEFDAATVLADDRRPVVGMAGPLEAVKGVSFFLRACHRVVDQGYDIRIIIAGRGPEERHLRQLSESLNLTERLTFVDGGTSLKAWLSAMDIFCLPSLQQGLGVMMLEALAVGRPVVASGVGGVFSVIEDNQTGLIVPPSDSRRLAERIIELLDQPTRARNLAVSGRDMVAARFNEDRMLNELLQLYEDLRTATPTNPGTIRLKPAAAH